MEFINELALTFEKNKVVFLNSVESAQENFRLALGDSVTPEILGYLFISLSGLLFLVLLREIFGKKIQVPSAEGLSSLEGKVVELEMALQEAKNQNALLRGQAKADFGYLAQEIEELKVTLESVRSDGSEVEEESLRAASGF